VGEVVGLSQDAMVDVVSIAAAAAAGVLLHLVARRVWDRRLAWVSSALWLVYPLTLWTSKQPNSELPFMVLFYAALVALLPVIVDRTGAAPRLVGAAALLGLAAAIRPAGLLLVPAAALVVALRVSGGAARRAALATGFVVAGSIPVLLASAWMSAEADHFVLLTDAEDTNLVEGLTFAADSQAEVEDLAMPGDLREFVRETQRREVELNAPGAGREHLLDTAREDPLVVAELIGYKALRSWYGTESFRYEIPLALVQVLWVGGATAGAALSWRRGAGPRGYVVMVVAFTLAAWATAIAALSIVRYLVPTLGLLAPLVAVAVVTAWARLRRGLDPPSPDAVHAVHDGEGHAEGVVSSAPWRAAT
jgi:hypothetical protein